MCYSAQIKELARHLVREFGVALDYAAAERIFLRRLREPGINISRGFEANFDSPVNDAERRIKALIDEHRSQVAAKCEQDLFTQKTRLVNAERSLQEKETRKSREDVRIATNRMAALTMKLGDLRRCDIKARDNRLFPMVYGGVIINQDGQVLLTPMRYFCRPAGKPAQYDKKYPGLYNARRDNLEKFWREQFGRHHALAVVDSFYENVKLHAVERRELAPGEEAKNVVLHFKPQPEQAMLVACVWSHWTDPTEPDVRGFAAITDDPPPEIAAAGHDRCPINIKRENVDAWLAPQGRSSQELQWILSDRQLPYYQHEVMAA
jgi:putative SOS response-associated peptidase YedK